MFHEPTPGAHRPEIFQSQKLGVGQHHWLSVVSSRLIKFLIRRDVTTLLGGWLRLGRERCIDLTWIDVVEVITDRLECNADENLQQLRRGIACGEKRVDRLLTGVSALRD